MNMTAQDKMRDLLAKAGIPSKEIKVFGPQILITCLSRDAASRWDSLLRRFATVRKVWESIDYNRENHKTCLNPSVHTVWRVSAAL